MTNFNTSNLLRKRQFRYRGDKYSRAPLCTNEERRLWFFRYWVSFGVSSALFHVKSNIFLSASVTAWFSTTVSIYLPPSFAHVRFCASVVR